VEGGIGDTIEHAASGKEVLIIVGEEYCGDVLTIILLFN